MKYGEKSRDEDFGALNREPVSNLSKEADSFSPPSVASRARNRTVMLSSDVTGQVRSLLQGVSGVQDMRMEQDSFQKPQEAVPSFDSVRKKVERTDLGLTKSHTSPSFALPPLNVPKSEERFDTKLDHRVEGTIELQNSKLLNGDRRLNELGIGIPASETRKNDTTDYEDERGATKIDLNKRFLKDDEPAPKVNSPILHNPPAPRSKMVQKSRIVGFLVSYDNEENGEITEIRVGRWIISSQDSKQDNLLFINDQSVSSMHAILKVSEVGDIQLVDQLSEKGTGILRMNTGEELDASESPIKVQHGDLVRLGNRYFVYCGIPKIQIEN